MELKPLTQTELDTFVSSQPHSQFLQSWSWGEFQKNVGRQVWCLGVFFAEGEPASGGSSKLVASASFIEMPLGLKKSYLYCPRGPIIKNGLSAEAQAEAEKLFLSKARDLTIETKQAEEIFFRFEPTFELKNSKVAPSEVKGPQLIKTKSIQPTDTLILDLTKTTEQLLAAMHPKTRYNIHLAEKHGVKIKRAVKEDFEKCWPLFLQTSRRDRFNLHPKSHYQKMVEIINEVELWVALNKNNDIIAANLVSFYGDTATYLHGASDYNARQLMAPHLLQWTLILEAKNRGYKYYDFHGVAPKAKSKGLPARLACPTSPNLGRRAPARQAGQKAKSNHPWAGITRFKTGFGGQEINYPGTYDFIYEPGWYQLYKMFRKINRLIKHG